VQPKGAMDREPTSSRQSVRVLLSARDGARSLLPNSSPRFAAGMGSAAAESLASLMAAIETPYRIVSPVPSFIEWRKPC
jgi:hypothetical protein